MINIRKNRFYNIKILRSFFIYLLGGTWHKDTKSRINQFIQKNDVVLDIGALSSPYTKECRNKVVAIDIIEKGQFGFSKQSIENLKSPSNRKSKIIPLYANAENLPFKNNIFDKILLTEVLEHIENDKQAVREMARVLKKEGAAFVTTPNLETVPLDSGIKEHFRHYSEHDLKKLFIPAFKNISIKRRFFINLFHIQDRYPYIDNKSNLILINIPPR